MLLNDVFLPALASASIAAGVMRWLAASASVTSARRTPPERAPISSAPVRAVSRALLACASTSVSMLLNASDKPIDTATEV